MGVRSRVNSDADTRQLEEELERLLRAGSRRAVRMHDASMQQESAFFFPKSGGTSHADDIIIGRSGRRYSRKRIHDLVSRKPQVMLKISTYRKTVADIKNHLNYISRNGKVPLEDQNGNPIEGRCERGELAEQWHDLELMKARSRAFFLGRELDEFSYPRVAVSLVFSMPQGTDRERFAAAVRGYLREQFADDGYEYVLALHNDTQHPHAHVLLRMRNIETNRKINPGKADIRKWRDALQEKMEEHGLFTVSIPSRLRGLMSSKNVIGVHMDLRDMRRAMRGQGISEEDINRLLEGKGKSQVSKVANRKDILTRRQTNLRATVQRALKDPNLEQRMRAFAVARARERQALREAFGNLAKDIVRDNPNEAAMLIQYVKDLPDEVPQALRILDAVKQQAQQGR